MTRDKRGQGPASDLRLECEVFGVGSTARCYLSLGLSWKVPSLCDWRQAAHPFCGVSWCVDISDREDPVGWGGLGMW